ncbi:MAG: UDP-N-acetylmuramoyl-tripeptide--D-alanyl-D-alanine ligase [Chloroflexi bacterium]|nr:UDP-N-acetylmuramoyl-tripeptide--D-alanyl-D-alanine ligase [Chloroflexota bacterium]
MDAACATLDLVTEATPPSSLRGWGPSVPAIEIDEIARVTRGRILARGSASVRGAAVDSRLVESGHLFVALEGERTDGHRYLAAAAAAGAAVLLVRAVPRDQSIPPGVGVVAVQDPLAGLHAVAAAWRTRFHPLTVGVTGSIAKTSTKDAVAAVLSARFATLKSEGNQNNEIGLPLTILRLGPEHEAAVLEMGMYVGGEIATMAAIARPRIGVVTAVQAVHLSRIGTLDAIERAKGELIEALPADGLAVLNADDERVRRMAARTSARSLTYGFGADADVRADEVTSAGPAGMRFRLLAPGVEGVVDRVVAIPTLGRHAVHNALAAAAVGLGARLSVDEVARGLARTAPSVHRGELIAAGPITILDDSYNAAPRSMRAALELLATLPGRRVAVLGEMYELGEGTEPGHREVGVAAATLADVLMVVGEGARPTAEAARATGLPANQILEVADRDAAQAALRTLLRPGDVVLIKASRGAELDRLVEALRDEWGAPGARP